MDSTCDSILDIFMSLGAGEVINDSFRALTMSGLADLKKLVRCGLE